MVRHMIKGLFGNSPTPRSFNSEPGVGPNGETPGVVNEKLVMILVQNSRGRGAGKSELHQNSEAGVVDNYRVVPPPSETCVPIRSILFSSVLTIHAGLYTRQIGYQPRLEQTNEKLSTRTIAGSGYFNEKLTSRWRLRS